MKNRFKTFGDTTVIHLQKGIKTYIDTADLPRAQEFPHSWYAYKSHGDIWYVIGKIRINGKRISFMLHRWVTNAPEDKQVDHKDHDGLNNRRSTNLRVVTQSGNQQNRKEAIGKTGFRGVYKKGNGYKVEITVNEKRLYLGYYSDPEYAAMVAATARRRLMPCTQETLLTQQEAESEALWTEIRERYLTQAG